jgi:hypothetical protein
VEVDLQTAAALRAPTAAPTIHALLGRDVVRGLLAGAVKG